MLFTSFYNSLIFSLNTDNMKTFLNVLFLFIAFSRAAGQTKNPVVTQNRTVPHFDTIICSGVFDVAVQFSPENEGHIQVNASSNIIDYIETIVEGLTLNVRFGNNTPPFSAKAPMNISIAAKSLNTVIVSESSTVIIEGIWTGQDLYQTVNGAASLINQINASNLYTNIAGSGSISSQINVTNSSMTVFGAGRFNISGSATNVDIIVRGSGEFEGAKLVSQTAMVKVSGAGQANIWVEKLLMAKASGVGTIIYGGNPQLETDSTFTATIEPASTTLGNV